MGWRTAKTTTLFERICKNWLVSQVALTFTRESCIDQKPHPTRREISATILTVADVVWGQIWRTTCSVRKLCYILRAFVHLNCIAKKEQHKILGKDTQMENSVVQENAHTTWILEELWLLSLEGISGSVPKWNFSSGGVVVKRQSCPAHNSRYWTARERRNKRTLEINSNGWVRHFHAAFRLVFVGSHHFVHLQWQTCVQGIWCFLCRPEFNCLCCFRNMLQCSPLVEEGAKISRLFVGCLLVEWKLLAVFRLSASKFSKLPTQSFKNPRKKGKFAWQQQCMCLSSWTGKKSLFSVPFKFPGQGSTVHVTETFASRVSAFCTRTASDIQEMHFPLGKHLFSVLSVASYVYSQLPLPIETEGWKRKNLMLLEMYFVLGLQEHSCFCEGKKQQLSRFEPRENQVRFRDCAQNVFEVEVCVGWTKSCTPAKSIQFCQLSSWCSDSCLKRSQRFTLNLWAFIVLKTISNFIYRSIFSINVHFWMNNWCIYTSAWVECLNRFRATWNSLACCHSGHWIFRDKPSWRWLEYWPWNRSTCCHFLTSEIQNFFCVSQCLPVCKLPPICTLFRETKCPRRWQTRKEWRQTPMESVYQHGINKSS